MKRAILDKVCAWKADEMGNGGMSFQLPGTFVAIHKLDGEVGPADRITTPRKEG